MMLVETALTDASKNDVSMLIPSNGREQMTAFLLHQKQAIKVIFNLMEKRGYKLRAIGSNLIFTSTDLKQCP